MASDKKLDFSDLGAVPVQPSQPAQSAGLDFSDLGAVKVQPTIAPPEVQQAAQNAQTRADAALSEFKPENARVGQALKHGFSTTIRALDRISNRFVPQGAPTPAPIEQMPIVKNLVPEAGYEPKGAVEHAMSLAGSFADPMQLLVNQGAGLIGEKLASSEALTAAEQAFAAKEAQDTASALYKARMLAGAKKGAVEGAISGGYIGGTSSIAEGETDPARILKRTVEGAAGGSVGGALLGAGAKALTGKPKFTPTESFYVPETPTTQALQSNMEKIVSQQAKLAEDLKILQGSQTGNEKLMQAYDKTHLADAGLVDSAAQRAAEIEAQAAERQQQILDQRAQQAASTESTIAQRKQEVANLQLQPTPIEERFSAQERLNNAIKSHEDNLSAIGEKTNQEVAATQQAAQKNLAQLSDTLDSRLKTLDEQRQKLLAQTQLMQNASQDKIAELQAKLQDNLNRQAALKDHMESLNFDAVRAKKNIPQMLDIAHAQVKKVDESLAKGLISPEQAQTLRQSEWDNALRLQGYNPSNRSANPLGAILNRTEQMNQIDRLHGTRAGEVIIQADIAHNKIANFQADTIKAPLEAAKRLVAMGIPENDIPRMLQYVESDGAGNFRFNPTAVSSPKLTRPDYYGPAITPEMQAELNTLRQYFDDMRAFSGAEKVPGYVPLMDVAPQPGLSKASARGIVDPSHLQQRTSGELVPGQHETNIFKMIPRYSRQVARAQFLAEPLEQGISELNKLRLLGQVDAANKVDGALQQALGINGQKEMSDIMAGQIVNYHKDILDKVAAALPDSEGLTQQVHKEVSRLMYLSMVPTKALTVIKQAIQPELMGQAEIGMANMAKGRTGLLQKEYRQIADRLVGMTKTRDLPELAEVAGEATSKIAKGIRLLSAPLKPFERLYDKVEILNRKVSIVGALRQAETAMEQEGVSGLRKIASNMLTSEQNLIERTLKEQGEQAAKELYAVLRARRINFSYGLADKPEMLNNMMGKQIPFTGFSRGVMNRIVGDLSEGNYSTLAKRIAYPMVGTYLFEKMSGYNIPGAQPAPNAIDVARMNIAPQYTEPLKTLAQTGSPAKAAEKALDFTPYGAYKRLEKTIKEGGSDPVKQLGLKPASQSQNWLRKLE